MQLHFSIYLCCSWDLQYPCGTSSLVRNIPCIVFLASPHFGSEFVGHSCLSLSLALACFLQWLLFFLLLFILISLAHATNGCWGSFWRWRRRSLPEMPRGRGRWRPWWGPSTCWTACGALPWRQGLEHAPTPLLKHLLLKRKQRCETGMYGQNIAGESLWRGKSNSLFCKNDWRKIQRNEIQRFPKPKYLIFF